LGDLCYLQRLFAMPIMLSESLMYIHLLLLTHYQIFLHWHLDLLRNIRDNHDECMLSEISYVCL
jgi:hypothetical protein